MRVLLSLVLVVLLAGAASASPSLVNHQPQHEKGWGDGVRSQILMGGESFGTATVIPGLPYTDSGATCGYIQDVVPCCGYAASPDLFYSYTSPGAQTVSISLCGSGYDTILAIYDSAGNCLACNDDFCGLQSEIDNFTMGAGLYYIQVTGYASSCGSYTLTVSPPAPPCQVTCPAGALIEGEPDCYDGYVDMYNGGCNSTPQVFQDVSAQSGTSAVMCGKSGTYLYQGLSYRDTDWFRVHGVGGTLTETCIADFPLQLIFIYGTNCASPLYDYTTANPCQSVSLSRTVGSGVEAWMWVGPSQFNGVPCGSNYVLSLDGIAGGTEPTGACCMPDHSCVVVTRTACSASGGVYQGDGVACTPSLCASTATEPSTWGHVKDIVR